MSVVAFLSYNATLKLHPATGLTILWPPVLIQMCLAIADSETSSDIFITNGFVKITKNYKVLKRHMVPGQNNQ